TESRFSNSAESFAIRWLPVSKHQSQAELQLAVLIHLDRLVATCGGNLTECRIAEIRVGPVKMRRVAQVEGFRPEFQAGSFRHAESSEDREVDFQQSRTVQDVAAGIPEGVGQWGRKRRGVEIQLAGADIAEDLHGSVDIGPVNVAGSIQACVADRDI